MNKSKFLTIYKVLTDSISLWNQEILQYYPASLNNYPSSWIEKLNSLSEQELWEIDAKQDYSSLKNSELDFLEDLNELTKFSSDIKLKELPNWAYHKVRPKKKHELISISSFLDDFLNRHHFNNVIDIGGGLGLLSRVITNHHAIPSTVVEIDSKLTSQAIKNFAKQKNTISPQFINENFYNYSQFIDQMVTNNTLIIGLHTCGPLANIQIKAFLDYKIKGLINFGCCYMKLRPDDDLYLSHTAQENRLPISNHSLTLASRAETLTLSSFKMKKRVKFYRYALHLYLYNHLDIKSFKGVGNSNIKLYNKDFATYFKTKTSHIKRAQKITANELNSFYNDHIKQELLNSMFLSNIIRWQFGRLIELYILLDRSLFLEEHGIETHLQPFFNESISPRNLGIVAFQD